MSALASRDGPDVGTVLTHQHERLKWLMDAVVSSSGLERRGVFDQVRRLLAAHEAVDAIARLEQLDVASEEFAVGFVELQRSAIAHAGAEEQRELPAVVGGLAMVRTAARSPSYPHDSSTSSSRCSEPSSSRT